MTKTTKDIIGSHKKGECPLNRIWYSQKDLNLQIDTLRSLMSKQHYDIIESLKKELMSLSYESNERDVVLIQDISKVFNKYLKGDAQ